MVCVSTKDRHEAEQLAMDLGKIAKECPHFVAYLGRSVEQTLDAIGGECRTEWLLKHSGAIEDLRKILSDIRDPRAVLFTGDGAT